MTDKTISAKEWREAAQVCADIVDWTPKPAMQAGRKAAAAFCEAQAKLAEQRETGNPIYRQLHSCAFCDARYRHECSPKPTPTVTAEDLRAGMAYWNGTPGIDDKNRAGAHRAIREIFRDYAERKGMGPL